MNSQQPHTPSSGSRWVADAAVWGLLGLVAVRCWILLDRRLPTESLADLADGRAWAEPAGLFLDLLLVAVAAGVLSARWMEGKKVHWLWVALWALGAAVAIGHAWADPLSQARAFAWVGATAAAVAAAHLGADPAYRRVLMAGAVALAVPLMAEGVFQYTHQHDQMVAEYESNRAEHHRRMGHDTRTIQKYERRLKQREPRGPFPFANLYATVSLSLGFGALGLAWGLWRGGGPKPAFTAALVLGIVSLGAVLLSGSKGAAVACAVAAGAIGAAAWTARKVRLKKTVWVAAACGVIVIGFAAVLLRGAAGAPQTAAGERSLLFRSHYWSAAASMLEQKPWFGVGPGRFQHAYLQHKPPINPEEVADPHNVFVAWVAALGLGGLAWAMWVWAMWVRSATAAAERDLDESDEQRKTIEANRRLVAGSVVALAAAFALVYFQRFVLSVGPELRLYTAAVLLLPLGGTASTRPWGSGLSERSGR